MSRIVKSCAALALCLVLTLSLCATALAAINITTQPKNVTVGYGETAKVTVKAEGTGVKYIWYYRSSSEGEWKKSSVTSRAYSVTMNEARDGRQLRCRVIKGDERVWSNTVTLSLDRQELKVTEQPQDVSVAPDAKATISVSAVGDGLTYTWYTRDKGATSWTKSSITKSAYSVTMNEARDGREVYCVVKDAYGEKIETASATMNMVKTYAEITAQPQDVSVAPGATAKISVSAIGDGLTYTWYTMDEGASSWTKSSITRSAYSVTMNDARHARRVKVVVKDAYGTEVESEVATMYQVKVEAAFTKQPESVTVASGEKATISVSAIGDGLTYTWYTKDRGASSWTKSSITKNSYSVTMTEARHKRQLYCLIKDAYDNKVKSEIVTMNMIVPEIEITAQPQDVLVAPGEKASITVEATGKDITYTWYTRDAGASSWTKSSITRNTYAVTMTEARHGREVYCVITDKYGEKKNTEIAKMEMVITPLEIPVLPETEVTVALGERAEVTVDATGDGLTYTWYSMDRGADKFVKSSIISKTYGVTMTTARHGRRIYCEVKDAYGNKIETPVITLNAIVTPLEILSQPQSVVVASGAQARVTVDATGDGLTYKWYYAAADSTNFVYTSSFTSNSYYVSMTEARSGRQVYCVITDAYGNAVTTETATLSMKGTLAITEDLPDETYIDEGAPITLSFGVVGDGLTYQWYHKLPGATNFTAASTSETYTLAAAGTEMNGLRVYCIVTDAYGAEVLTSETTIKYKAPLAIVTQPVSVAVLEGEDATVTFEATGDGLTYEWYFAAPGSTEFRLTTSFTSNEYSVEMNEDRDGRQVYCVITDMYGASVQTETVTLSIKPPVEYTIVDGTATITAYIGSETTLVIPSALEGATVTAIADSAFANNATLTSVTLPKTVTSIGASAFESCSALKSVTLSDNVATIGRAAFKNCTSLETMTISN